jgi:heptosyltransferase-1
LCNARAPLCFPHLELRNVKTYLEKGGESVLVVRLGAIGDVLRVLPALRRLRTARPDLTIGWAVEDWVYPVVAGNPNVDRFHVLRRGRLRASEPRRALGEIRRFIKEVRACRYDAALDFHGRFKSGVVTRLSGAPLRIGFARGVGTEANHLFTNVHVNLEDPLENRVLRFLHLLAPLGLDTAWDPGETGLYIEPALRETARAWHRSIGAPPLAVFPGTSEGRARERWPEKKWIDLLSRVGAAGVRSAVFWGPAEQALAARVVAAAGSQVVLAPATTLPEMTAMIGCFNAFIGSDTAAMHMAWLQGIPAAVFVGPKPPRTVAPLQPMISRVLRADEFYVEGLRPRHQAADIVAAVAVGEAADAVRYVIDASKAVAVERGEIRPS